MDVGSIMAVFGLRAMPQSEIMAALRSGAQSTTALVTYALLALSWIVLFASAQRLSGFSSALQDLPELQRATIFKRAYPSFATLGLSTQDFAQRRQRRIWLLALLALVLAASAIGTAAVQAV